MNSDIKIVHQLVEEYCTSNKSLRGLVTFIHSCLKKSMDFTLPLDFKPHFKHYDCSIDYDLGEMTFTLFKADSKEEGSVYELGANVQSYLRDHYGSTPTESLIKHVFFSDLDIEEVAIAIATDLHGWATSIEKIFDDPIMYMA